MMTRSPPVLLFVPGVTPIDGNHATRVAEVIACSLSVHRAGTYGIKLDTSDQGSTDAISILGPAGDVVLRVVEVDYRAQLAETPYGNGAHGWALLRAGRFALLGLLRLLAAGRRAKTGRQRLFLLAGFVLVQLLIFAFGALALLALAALDPNPNLNAKLTTCMASHQLAWGASLTFAAGALYWLRARIIMGGQRVREIVRYLERALEAASVARELDVAIDDLLDQGPPPSAIHILAYSFGSIVALDALFPRTPHQTKAVDRTAAAITSLSTVGCPVDFVRQFYPRYLEGRTARRSDLAWTNIFLPEDVLGSNFRDDDDHSGYESPPADKAFGIAGVRPMRSLAVGTERLSLVSLLSLEGFRIHGDYWGQAHRANLLEPVIDTWVPLAASPPDTAEPALGSALTIADLSQRAAPPSSDAAAAAAPAEDAAGSPRGAPNLGSTEDRAR